MRSVLVVVLVLIACGSSGTPKTGDSCTETDSPYCLGGSGYACVRNSSGDLRWDVRTCSTCSVTAGGNNLSCN